MGKPLVFYISHMTVRYVNVMGDVEPHFEGLFVYSSFQKVRKTHSFEPNKVMRRVIEGRRLTK